ncbi:MAG: hypothetical protein WKG32_15605 [Gemmatimonadaceae bacterium]
MRLPSLGSLLGPLLVASLSAGLLVTLGGCGSSRSAPPPASTPEPAARAAPADSTTPNGTSAAAPTRAPVSRRKDPNVIPSEELTASRYPTVYAAIEALHPTWLRPQEDIKSFHGAQPHVPVFEGRQHIDMGLDYLRQLGPVDFVHIVRLNSIESTSRYGADHGWGALVVYRR